jgi:hypothetical protein
MEDALKKAGFNTGEGGGNGGNDGIATREGMVARSVSGDCLH